MSPSGEDRSALDLRNLGLGHIAQRYRVSEDLSSAVCGACSHDAVRAFVARDFQMSEDSPSTVCGAPSSDADGATGGIFGELAGSATLHAAVAHIAQGAAKARSAAMPRLKGATLWRQGQRRRDGHAVADSSATRRPSAGPASSHTAVTHLAMQRLRPAVPLGFRSGQGPINLPMKAPAPVAIPMLQPQHIEGQLFAYTCLWLACYATEERLKPVSIGTSMLPTFAELE